MESDAGAIIFGNAREATQKCVLNLHTATPTETYEHLARVAGGGYRQG